jgi:hypothetical protein
MSTEEFPKYDESDAIIDYLEEDPEIPTQRYAIISFLSPERVIKQKAEFFNTKFLEWLDLDWKVSGMENFVAYVSKKYSLNIETVFKDLEDFKKVHLDEIKKTDIVEKYQVFLLKHEKDVETEFTEKIGFRTNVRGIKVRRVFANLEECQMHAKVMHRKYPRDSLFIGKVGAWLPWDPSEHLMPEVEYAERELNELMRKYKENEVNRDIFYEQEKSEKINAQKLENDRRRKQNLLDSGVEEIEDVQKRFDTPLHPSEGALREML